MNPLGDKTLTLSVVQEPLVSIITSTFREVLDGTLERSINSVRAQRYQNWELWVVEDGSLHSDQIEGLIARYNDPRIHAYHLPEKGEVVYPGLKPKQKGVELSKGEFLCFLDADNEYLADHLELAVPELAANPELDLVYCDSVVRLVHPVMGLTLPFHWKKPEWSQKRAERMKKSNFIDMSEAVIRRSSYDNSGGLRESVPYAIDWGLFRDMVNSGNAKFRHLPNEGLVYYTSSLGHHAAYFFLMLIENRMKRSYDLEKKMLKRRSLMEAKLMRKQEGYSERK